MKIYILERLYRHHLESVVDVYTDKKLANEALERAESGELVTHRINIKTVKDY